MAKKKASKKKAGNDTEVRITFKNGSFIKLDGSANTEAYRSVKK